MMPTCVGGVGSGSDRAVRIVLNVVVVAGSGLAVLAAGIFWPWLARLPLGRLPGDIHFVRNGREYSFPFASSLLLSALLTWLLYVFR